MSEIKSITVSKTTYWKLFGSEEQECWVTLEKEVDTGADVYADVSFELAQTLDELERLTAIDELVQDLSVGY